MSTFTLSDSENGSTDRKKEDLAKHLEAAVQMKAEENLALYQELLRKQALLEEAEALFDEANELVEQRIPSNGVTKGKTPSEVAGVSTTITTTTRSSADAVGNCPERPQIEESQTSPIAECIGEKLAPYNPTNMEACNVALDLLDLKDDDTLYDLGCGDARLLVEAWNRVKKRQKDRNIPVDELTFRVVGIEYDSLLHRRGQENLQANGLMPQQATVIHGNVLDFNFSDATALFVYLVPTGMKALRDTLIALMTENKEVRVVTYVFSIPNLEPKEVCVYKLSTKLYLYDHSCTVLENLMGR